MKKTDTEEKIIEKDSASKAKGGFTIQLIKVILFLVICTLIYIRAEQILEERTSSDKYAEFFKEKQDIPVLLMGNSHMTNGIYPMELYKDYGIVSYNFGGHGNTMPTTYWIAENAMDYTSPKLMVVDCKDVSSELLHNEQVRYLHVSLDCFPMSRTKLDTINDILATNEKNEFLWKWWIYHDRWSELEKEDFTGAHNMEKGAETRINVTRKITPWKYEDEKLKLESESMGVKYLRKLIEDCQSRGVQVLLVYLPFSITDEVEIREMNSMKDLAEEYNVNYLNFNALSLVDYDTDYFDKNGHMNPSGARKVTDYLGSYIKDNYELEDLRENPDYASWKESYDKYHAMKLSDFEQEKDGYNLTMLLADKNFEAHVTICSKKAKEDELFLKLLSNADITATENIVNDQGKEAEDGLVELEDIHVMVKEKVTGNIVLDKGYVLKSE